MVKVRLAEDYLTMNNNILELCLRLANLLNNNLQSQNLKLDIKSIFHWHGFVFCHN